MPESSRRLGVVVVLAAAAILAFGRDREVAPATGDPGGSAQPAGATRTNADVAAERAPVALVAMGARALRVADRGDRAIAGATVRCADGNVLAIADASGRCVVATGASLLVTAPGFAASLVPRATRDVSRGDEVRAEELVVLRRGDVIAGRVVDPAGMPIPGVSVVVDFGGMHGCEARGVRIGSSVHWVPGVDGGLGLTLESTTGADGRFTFTEVPAGEPTLSVRCRGYVQAWTNDAGRAHVTSSTMRLPGDGSDVTLTVQMYPLYVAVVAGTADGTLPVDYLAQGIAGSFEPPDGALGLPYDAKEGRAAAASVRAALQEREPRAVLCCDVVALGSATDRRPLEGQVVWQCFGRRFGPTAVTYSRLATWSPADCAFVALGSAPAPCEVTVEARASPRIHTSTGAICSPLSSAGSSHRFLVPPGASTVVPGVGLASRALHQVRFDAPEGGCMRLAADWQLSTVRLVCLGRTGHATAQGTAEVVSAAGIGRLRLPCPVAIPALPVEPGDYEVRLRDAADRPVDSKRVTVTAGSTVDVVLRYP